MTETNEVNNYRSYVILVLAIIAVGVLTWYLASPSDEPQQPTPEVVIEPVPEPAPVEEVVEAPEPMPEVTEEEPVVTPEPVPPRPEPAHLNSSDEPFATGLARLGPAHPVMEWLSVEQIIRKSVAFVDGLSRGELIFKNRPLNGNAVPGEFTVIESEERIILDAANYARYDTLISAIEFIDIDSAMSFLEFWEPRLDQAYQELGMGGTFRETLLKAIDQMLETEVTTGEVALVKPSVYYRFEDERLEQASDVEKMMIRIGPANADRLKAKLTSLKNALTN